MTTTRALKLSCPRPDFSEVAVVPDITVRVKFVIDDVRKAEREKTVRKVFAAVARKAKRFWEWTGSGDDFIPL